MRIQRFETKVTASYTTDTARRQITAIQAKYKDLTSLQTKLLASNRLTAGFTQNTMRDLLEMSAPVPVVYTTAKLLTAVKVAKKDEAPAKNKPVATGGAKATKGKSDAEAIKKLMQQADPLTKAMAKKPEATAESKPTAPKKAKVKLTVADVLNLIDNFANTQNESGEDDTLADDISSARTRIESLNLKELSPKLVELQRGVLERLNSVKTPGKLETFLATESEKLRTALKKFESEQSPAKPSAVPTYHKNKFLDLMAELEDAEDNAVQGGEKLTSFKTLVKSTFEEMYQEALGFGQDEFKVLIKEAKDAVENAGNVKKVVEESKSARSKISSYIDEEVRQGRLKDSGRQEPTEAAPEKEDNKEAAKEQLQYFNTALSSAPKTLPKNFLSTKIYPILDKLVESMPSLKSLSDFFKSEMDKQEKPTSKLFKALGDTLVSQVTKQLDEPEDSAADEDLVEDPNDFAADDTIDEPTGFEFADEEEPAQTETKDEAKTGFEMDDEEPVAEPTPTTTKAPRRVLDEDVEETPEPTPEVPVAPPTAPAAKSRVSAPKPAAAPKETAKPSAPPITEQQAAKPTPGQFDVSGQEGELQLKPTSVKLDPANKQLIQKHQALAKDLNSLFYELQTVAARVNTSLADSVPPKTIEAIQSSLGRLGEQVKISMLASLKAIREMTAAHIPKTFADTVKNLNNLLVKTIPTKIPPAVHTFMFIDEDDELCFTSYIVLTRPTDKQGRTIPRLFIYLTYRTQKHKMYVCTSRNMLPLSEDLFRMPFTSPKTMAIGLDRLLSLDNFHSNLAKVDLRTVFGKGGVESAAIINDFPAISSIEQDGEELVFALSDSIGEGQEALVERQANQLENRLKLGLGKKFRIFKSYKFVNTAINPDDVYSDPADNKTAEPKAVNKPTPHFEIRLSFTAVPGAEPITTADLDFLKDRFIKLNDDAIRRMVRIANES